MIYRMVSDIDTSRAIVSSQLGIFWNWCYVMNRGKWEKVEPKYSSFFDPFVLFAPKITKREIFVELL